MTLRTFVHSDDFPHAFGQVRAWIIHFLQVVVVYFAVACSINLPSFVIEVGKEECSNLTLSAPTAQNGQAHSKAVCGQIVWVSLTILWGWRLKG